MIERLNALVRSILGRHRQGQPSVGKFVDEGREGMNLASIVQHCIATGDG